jgi:lipid-binding SYLF domain-containing protein
MRKRSHILVLACLCILPGGRALAGTPEEATVDSATAVLQDLAGSTFRCIPQALLEDAQGVAIIPNVIKAGFVLGGRHGRGVVLIRQPDGCWSNPWFVTLSGGSIGWQVGVQSTDIVLVFKTRNGLDRIMKGKGKLTLGADVSVAAGPVGRQVEAATDGQLKAEIYSYSRSRGLFAGLSVEGAGLLVDQDATGAFYRMANAQMVAEKVRGELTRVTLPPPPPAVIVPAPVLQPPQPVPPPPPPVVPPAPPAPPQPTPPR